MRPSVGRSRERRSLGRRPLRSCQNRVEEDNVVLIDEENDNCENVVVIDIPESTPTKDRGGSERLRRGKSAATSWTGVICLDDDDMDDHSDGDCVMNEGNVKNGCSSSRKSNPSTSANFGSSSTANQENVSPVKLSKGKRTYSGKNSSGSGTRFGIYDIDELSCDDLPDCEVMEDSCGSVKEMWEKAYTKRKWDSRYGQTAQGDSDKDTYDVHENVKISTDSGQCREPPSVTKPTEHEGEASSIHKKKRNMDYTADDSLSDSTDKGIEDIFIDSMVNIHFSYDKNTDDTRGSSFNVAECNSCHFSEPSSSGMPSREEQKLKEPSSFPCQGKDTEQVNHANKHSHNNAEVPLRDSCTSRPESCAKENVCVSDRNEVHSPNNPDLHDDETNECVIVGDREKHKETEEYKKAAEEEQASRQRALQIQAEEAQNLRRTRKREKAETMRILDVEKRQKQRLDEIRETEKKEQASRQRALQIQAEEAQNLRRARKREKAETLRILDVEKRQKQRLDEIRETEKKDQENSNLRDIIRAEVIRSLSMLEVTCNDMTSVLRALGIPVGGDLLPPLLSEVRVAYKKAILAFHPDRASRSDIRQQVEAEEKFKFISRMKEKFLPLL